MDASPTKKMRQVHLCEIHTYTDWMIGHRDKLIKRCLYCSKTMNVKEFMQLKKEPVRVAKKRVEIEINTHLDLFWG